MKQIEPKLDPPEIHFTRDGSDHNIDITDLLDFPGETTAVLIQARSLNVGGFGFTCTIKPAGTSYGPHTRYRFTTSSESATATIPTLINVGGFTNTITMESPTASGIVSFYLIAELGGEGFVPLPDTQGTVSPYEENVYRTETITPLLSGSDSGNVAGILGFATLDSPDIACNARRIDSTSNAIPSPRVNVNFGLIAPVNASDQVAILETGENLKGEDVGDQSSFINWVGYFRDGAFETGDGTGKAYRIRLPRNPQETFWKSPFPTWAEFDASAHTSLTAKVLILQSVHYGANGAAQYGIRSIGSSDGNSAVDKSVSVPTLDVVSIDEDGGVEAMAPTTINFSHWVFGWIEEQPATRVAIANARITLRRGRLAIQ